VDDEGNGEAILVVLEAQRSDYYVFEQSNAFFMHALLEYCLAIL
jgi:hypothetical protein